MGHPKLGFYSLEPVFNQMRVGGLSPSILENRACDHAGKIYGFTLTYPPTRDGHKARSGSSSSGKLVSQYFGLRSQPIFEVVSVFIATFSKNRYARKRVISPVNLREPSLGFTVGCGMADLLHRGDVVQCCRVRS